MSTDLTESRKWWCVVPSLSTGGAGPHHWQTPISFLPFDHCGRRRLVAKTRSGGHDPNRIGRPHLFCVSSVDLEIAAHSQSTRERSRIWPQHPHTAYQLLVILQRGWVMCPTQFIKSVVNSPETAQNNNTIRGSNIRWWIHDSIFRTTHVIQPRPANPTIKWNTFDQHQTPRHGTGRPRVMYAQKCAC